MLAGGRSSRFGSDKALAMLPDGRTLLDQALDRPEAERGAWLQALPAEHAALRPHLARVLHEQTVPRDARFLQAPRLAPHTAAMRANLAQALNLNSNQVNVKAKTAEKLGPVGENLSMEARAIALLQASPQ